MKLDEATARDRVKQFDFTKLNGLIPCIAQDNETGEVLMVGFQNEEALEKTLTTGILHYYSRTRKELWKKGSTSGHLQEVIEVWGDCDLDTVLAKVKQNGRACHVDGQYTCFFTRVDGKEITKKEPDFSQ